MVLVETTIPSEIIGSASRASDTSSTLTVTVRRALIFIPAKNMPISSFSARSRDSKGDDACPVAPRKTVADSQSLKEPEPRCIWTLADEMARLISYIMRAKGGDPQRSHCPVEVLSCCN